ncbi:unnamed protein product [Prorocentrum cordatum]|uniref:EF-hand domain-containing protein n=1 Tax=Prorocentrum cordatum TaxID=2364126 RepID=A0ABN9S8U7_9DINO|nr:unnamed protein product [Polarella glacialis]
MSAVGGGEPGFGDATLEPRRKSVRFADSTPSGDHADVPRAATGPLDSALLRADLFEVINTDNDGFITRDELLRFQLDQWRQRLQPLVEVELSREMVRGLREADEAQRRELAALRDRLADAPQLLQRAKEAAERAEQVRLVERQLQEKRLVAGEAFEHARRQARRLRQEVETLEGRCAADERRAELLAGALERVRDRATQRGLGSVASLTVELEGLGSLDTPQLKELVRLLLVSARRVLGAPEAVTGCGAIGPDNDEDAVAVYFCHPGPLRSSLELVDRMRHNLAQARKEGTLSSTLEGGLSELRNPGLAVAGVSQLAVHDSVEVTIPEGLGVEDIGCELLGEPPDAVFVSGDVRFQGWADRAGLAAGDLVLLADGGPLCALEPPQLQGALQRTRPLSLLACRPAGQRSAAALEDRAAARLQAAWRQRQARAEARAGRGQLAAQQQERRLEHERRNQEQRERDQRHRQRLEQARLKERAQDEEGLRGHHPGEPSRARSESRRSLFPAQGPSASPPPPRASSEAPRTTDPLRPPASASRAAPQSSLGAPTLPALAPGGEERFQVSLSRQELETLKEWHNAEQRRLSAVLGGQEVAHQALAAGLSVGPPPAAAPVQRVSTVQAGGPQAGTPARAGQQPSRGQSDHETEYEYETDVEGVGPSVGPPPAAAPVQRVSTVQAGGPQAGTPARAGQQPSRGQSDYETEYETETDVEGVGPSSRAVAAAAPVQPPPVQAAGPQAGTPVRAVQQPSQDQSDYETEYETDKEDVVKDFQQKEDHQQRLGQEEQQQRLGQQQQQQQQQNSSSGRSSCGCGSNSDGSSGSSSSSSSSSSWRSSGCGSRSLGLTSLPPPLQQRSSSSRRQGRTRAAQRPCLPSCRPRTAGSLGWCTSRRRRAFLACQGRPRHQGSLRPSLPEAPRRGRP